mmetsp:Transcript_2806/g.2436  ORF Transcript_2806/g.2436 Transcript_2806/m.2436 type:complete len:243 (-) Transcript_2806:1322-2050(-)
MSLFLSSLQFSLKNIMMNTNFLFSLLHTHLQLIFSVFKVVHLICGLHQIISNILDFKLHDIMLNQSLLLLLDDLIQVLSCHIILEGQFIDLTLQSLVLSADLSQISVNSSQIIFKLFQRFGEKLVMVGFGLEILLKFLNLLHQISSFFSGSLTSSSLDLSFHELNLIFSIVQEFLLSLELLIELIDMGLKVSAGSHITLDLTVEIGLIFSQFEKFLSSLEKLILEISDLSFSLALLLLIFLQ